MSNIETFYNEVDLLVGELKKHTEGTVEYQMAYGDLYNKITPNVKSFCNKEVARLKAKGIRACEDDYFSTIMSDVLMGLVRDFDTEKQKGFVKLLYYRASKSFVRLFKSSITRKQRALNTGIELDNTYFGTCEDEIDELKDISIFEALNEYMKINPKAKVLFAYELPYLEAMERIKRELGVEKYTSTDRWRVYDLKQRFFKYLQQQGYTHLTGGR